MTDQKYKDLMNGGWSYPKKESTDPEEVKKVVDKYLTDNKIDSETIDKKITDGVSKIVADAPEDFDTLKEMSDWISQHSDSAAAMNSDILDNKSSIESLQKDKANAMDVEALSGEVNNNTNAIESINNTIIASLASSTISNAGYVYNKVAVNLPQGNYLMHLKSNGTWGKLIVGLLDKNENRIAEYSLEHTSLNNGRTIDIYASRNISAIIMYTNSACTISEVMFSKNYNAVVDDASNINSSMSDYGLNNMFDGELEQGGIDSGTKVVKDNYVVTKNKVFCSPNDFIKTFGDNLESSYACFYKSDGTYIGGLNALDGVTVPSDSAYCYVEFKRSGITPSTAGYIGIYINNQIDVVMNDVDVLSGEVETLKTEVNNNTNDISVINDNLSTEDVDVFSGWTIQDSNRIVCDISVNGNDVLYWYLNFSWSNTINGGVIAYYDNSGTKISEDSIYYPATNKMKGNYTVPNNAVKARFILYFENGVTSTKYPTNVYLNKKPTIRGLGNAISNVNSDLDNLSYGETAGGKNLFKIDTTNWTLTDNGIKNNAKNDGYFLGKIKLFAGKTYKISFLLKSKPTVDSSFTAYIDGSVYSACTFAHLNSYALNVKVEKDYTATSDCELLYRLWGNSNSDIFEFQLQVEEGTVATDYKPYIPSVKMLSDDVSNINSSMSDYGLNNVFDGILKQGHYNSLGEWYDGDYFVTTSNAISCNANDLITVKYENPFEIDVRFFDANNNYIDANLYDTQVSEYQCTAPSGAKKFYVGIGYSYTEGKLTPKNARHLGVYINNQIDVVKNDVTTINNNMTWIRVAKVTKASTDDVINIFPNTWKEVMIDIENTTTSSDTDCYAKSVFTIYRECVTYNGNNYFRTGFANLVVNITGNHSIKIPEMDSGTAVTIYFKN